MRELRRCASPGGSVVAVAVERRGDFLAVACNSRGDDRLLAVYDFSQSEAPKLRARPQGNQRRSKTRLHLDVDGNEWAARWCESYNDDRPVAHRWDSADEWVELPFPDDITLVRDMTRGEGSKRKWTCAVCSGAETCVILWDESGSRSFVLPVEPSAYVFVPSGASCRVGRWAAAHASDAAEGYGSLVCVAHAATADGVVAVACAVRSDLKAAKAAGAARRSSIEQGPGAARRGGRAVFVRGRPAPVSGPRRRRRPPSRRRGRRGACARPASSTASRGRVARVDARGRRPRGAPAARGAGGWRGSPPARLSRVWLERALLPS